MSSCEISPSAIQARSARCWTAPGNQSGYTLASITPNVPGSNWQTTSLSGNLTATTVTQGSQVTCYILVALFGTTPLGNTDVLCAIPGAANLSSAAGGVRTSIAGVASKVRQAAAPVRQTRPARPAGMTR